MTHAENKGRYFEVGPLALPSPIEAKGRPTQAMPPSTLADGEVRVLKSPNGTLLPFRWVAADKAWFRGGGYRLAFSAVYLGMHGWSYSGLVAPVAMVPLAMPSMQVVL